MKIWKAAIVLFVIGILLSFSHMSQTATRPSIELTQSNHVLLKGEVNSYSVTSVQLQMASLQYTNPSVQLYLVLDTPGGSVGDGLRLIDFISAFPSKVNVICIQCGSMGYHIFQGLGDRIVIDSSELMAHRWYISISGQLPGEVQSELASSLERQRTIFTRNAKRIGLTYDQFLKLIYNEHRIDGATAVKTKHADYIANISCDIALTAVTMKTVEVKKSKTIVRTFSACPLIVKEVMKEETQKVQHD